MSIKNVILIILGFFTLVLGVVGIFLPIIPTTPFLVVSAVCLGNISPKLYDMLLNTKYFGEFISNYKNKNGVSKAVKSKSILFLWISLIISAIILKSTAAFITLAIIGIVITAHILMIKSR